MTKPEIALAQVKTAQAAGTPGGIVLADAGYGNDTGFRDGLTEIGALYAVGVQGTTSVWAPGQQPLPPKPWCGVGRKPRLLRRDAEHKPVSVKALAMGLPATDYRIINWRAGSTPICPRALPPFVFGPRIGITGGPRCGTKNGS